MEVHWSTDKLRREFEDYGYLKGAYGTKVADKIVLRLKELSTFPSYAELPPSARKHSIKDGRKFRYFTVDLPKRGGGRGNLRLALVPHGEFDMANQKTIVEVKILGIVDTH